MWVSAHVTTDDDRRLDDTFGLLQRASELDGEERARVEEEVVVRNMGVAESLARRFRNRGEPLDDLIQVAYLALTKAVRRFDPNKSDAFLRYAVPTITGELKRYFRDAAWTIRPGRRIQELQPAISAAAADLNQELGRSPRPSELAERLDVGIDDVTEALASDGCFTPRSLDDRGPGDTGSTLAETLGADDHDLDRAEVVALLRPACRKLTARDQRILFLRFFHGWTQARIADELDVTQMQVSRLLARILTDLRTELTDPPAFPAAG